MRVIVLLAGVVLLAGCGVLLVLGGPAWVALPGVVGLVLVVMAAPFYDDGSPPEGPGWSGAGPTGL